MALIPKNLVSFVTGKLVSWRMPAPFGKMAVKWFANRYKLNMEEAERSLEYYQSISEVFTRKLKPGIRPIGEGFVHPCDAQLTRGGPIRGDEMVQAKGKHYSLKGFCGGESYWKNYESGTYLTYYLCPTDYHRVHSPMKGEITACHYIPGRLWPVNPWSVDHVSQLFAVNERVNIHLNTERGPIVISMVGATNVGKMSMSFDLDIVTNQSHWRQPQFKQYSKPIAISKGQELGIFNMGSTVIVLTPQNFFTGMPAISGQNVKLGESMELKDL